MEVVVQVAQLLLALSILVGIHEGGHMIAARMFGMRVEKFFIGFPPTIFSFKKGDTEYGLGAVPLGGFVKISGMIDESMDKEQMKQEPQPWEFRSKPAWQRLIVMLGGIIVNVVAGIIAMIILTYNLGDQYIPSLYPKENGVIAYEYAQEMGFETGDKIIDVNGEDYEAFRDLTALDMFLSEGSYYTIERNGQRQKLTVPTTFLNTMSSDDEFLQKFLMPRFGFEISLDGAIEPTAATFGMQEGDNITQIGDQRIKFADELRPALAIYSGQEVPITVKRNGSEIVLDGRVKADSTLGVVTILDSEIGRNEYTFGQAVTKGTVDAFGLVIDNARALGKMFTGDLSPRSLSGPIGIFKIFPKTWDWNKFWERTAFISMILAFMNLLPIPALDGGHVVFLLFEMVSGKAPSDKFLENAQKVGMVILLALMVFVFGNDILKEIFGI
ncbi:MAG: RIP metalloprotease RseP [Roseivirga sp.]